LLEIFTGKKNINECDSQDLRHIIAAFCSQPVDPDSNFLQSWNERAECIISTIYSPIRADNIYTLQDLASAIYWFGKLRLKPGERFTLAWLRKAGRVIDQFDQRLLEETIAACKQLGIELNPAFLNQAAGLVDYDQSQQLVEEAKEEKEGEDVLSSVVNYDGNITVSDYDGGANDYSSSSSSSSGSYPGGGSGAVKTTELSDKGKEVLSYLSSITQLINIASQQFTESRNGNAEGCDIEALFKKLFQFEDLPEVIQEQRLGSCNLRQVLEHLKQTNTTAICHLPNEVLEEIFRKECLKNYGPDDSVNATEDARPSHVETSGLISIDGSNSMALGVLA
jgi:hypothetical protein